MELPHGKIPVDVLKEIVFKNLGSKRKEVILGPSLGVDGAVIDVGHRSMIVSMDPITGALDRIGWLAVNVNANDVATFGVEPAFLFSCILLPEGAKTKTIETICIQMDKAAENLGMAIVGGHCEVTPELVNPIVVGCAMGITKKGNYVTAAGAKRGDKLILTKTAGIEGTAILATDRKKQLEKAIGSSVLEKAQRMFSQISIVKEAVVAYRTGGVNAMHDPTEGGVAGGIHEMADASRLGVRVFESEIMISPDTDRICGFLGIDPLMLIASGALLISSKPQSADQIVQVLEKEDIHASIIGEFTENPRERVIVDRKGKTKPLERPLSDHLWKALAKNRPRNGF
jgi:hydrogenase maturation factor